MWLLLECKKTKKLKLQTSYIGHNGCGSVGRVVASNTRGPVFEFTHWKKYMLNICLLTTVWKRQK